MSALSDILKSQIEQHGPMSVSEFMGLALSHPKHGYYMSGDPFGVDGDFTTAPEISQMFGELIGAWFAAAWAGMEKPPHFTMLECGPGRGTLMADMIRVTKSIPGFDDAMDLNLLETSHGLRKVQHDKIGQHVSHWHDTLETLPNYGPLFVLGNEFFDALPVQHLIYHDGEWYERRVGLRGGEFAFLKVAASSELKAYVPVDLPEPEEGEIFELSILSRNIMDEFCRMVQVQGGVMLFIDYGHSTQGYGETLQAVYKHEYSNVFDHIGESDLTAHVDFAALAEVAGHHGLKVHGPVEQAAFLQQLGIGVRAEMLKANASEAQQKDIDSALHRLTHPDEMGALFKVIAVCRDDLKLDGF